MQKKEIFNLLETYVENKGDATIPSSLFESITFLYRALSIRAVPAFIELLIGAMLMQAGFVTDAWFGIPSYLWFSN